MLFLVTEFMTYTAVFFLGGQAHNVVDIIIIMTYGEYKSEILADDISSCGCQIKFSSFQVYI